MTDRMLTRVEEIRQDRARGLSWRKCGEKHGICGDRARELFFSACWDEGLRKEAAEQYLAAYEKAYPDLPPPVLVFGEDEWWMITTAYRTMRVRPGSLPVMTRGLQRRAEKRQGTIAALVETLREIAVSGDGPRDRHQARTCLKLQGFPVPEEESEAAA